MSLLREISEHFNCEEAADLSILYEVTGYKGYSQSHSFWEGYTDYEEFGDSSLIKQSRNENKQEFKGK